MRFKRYFFIVGVIACSAISAYAQLLPWPSDPEGYPYRVESAYGPRNVVRGTFFHKGLDLNEQNTGGNTGDADLNQPIIAPGDGTIFGIGRASDGIEWIGVDYGNNRTLAYLHIFPNNSAVVVGDISDVVNNQIAQNNQIRSYRRIITKNANNIDDNNMGIILFYSGSVLNGKNTGRIVKALGISPMHNNLEIAVPGALDTQPIPQYSPTPASDTSVVCAGNDGVLDTLPQGDDEYSVDKTCINAGINKIADSKAGYIVPRTTIISGEIIAPLGKSGANNSHLHLQISHADEKLANDPSAGADYNDGMDNVIQYLVHDYSQFSGGISVPTDNSTLYHTDDHNNERVTASIRWRPVGADWQIYHPYELDRVKIYVIPDKVAQETLDFASLIADNTYLINGNRSPITTALQLPVSSDTFRAEFNYGGAYNDIAFPPFIGNTGAGFRSYGATTGLNPQGDLAVTPITDFVFNQWNTGINKSFTGLAYRNEDAAYPDGQYGLIAVAESVDREVSERFISYPKMITIDNFRPYVKQVEVKQSTTTFYKRSWELDDKSMLRSYAPSVEEPIVPGEYTVITTFSEPMFEASLVNINNAFTPFTSVQVSTLAIGNYYLQDAMLPLEIRGMDIAGTANELLKIDPDKSYIDPALELTRGASGYMPAGGGSDKFHSLHVEAGFPPSIGYEDRNHILAHGCGGDTCGTEAEPIALAWNRVRFSYADIGSGIREISIRISTSATPERKFSYAPHVYNQEIELNLEDGLL